MIGKLDIKKTDWGDHISIDIGELIIINIKKDLSSITIPGKNSHTQKLSKQEIEMANRRVVKDA